MLSDNFTPVQVASVFFGINRNTQDVITLIFIVKSSVVCYYRYGLYCRRSTMINTTYKARKNSGTYMCYRIKPGKSGEL